MTIKIILFNNNDYKNHDHFLIEFFIKTNDNNAS